MVLPLHMPIVGKKGAGNRDSSMVTGTGKKNCWEVKTGWWNRG
jgi:hypothetical protein